MHACTRRYTAAMAAAAAPVLSPAASLADLPGCQDSLLLSIETPAATLAHAATTPVAAAAAAQQATVAVAAAAAAAALPSPAPALPAATAAHLPAVVAAAAAGDAAAAGTLEGCIFSFVQCVARSPVVKSALLSLEVAGSHPPAGTAADVSTHSSGADSGLEWTLAQLLALHIKADCLKASESSVLAALWVLESFHSADRSPATVCLDSYLKLLALFSEELVAHITTDWPNSFRKMKAVLVEAQADLLHRLSWRAALRYASEAQPCHAWLFRGQAGAAAGFRPSGQCGWMVGISAVCANVRKQADVFLQAQQARAHLWPDTPRGEAAARPCKRARAQQHDPAPAAGPA